MNIDDIIDILKSISTLFKNNANLEHDSNSKLQEIKSVQKDKPEFTMNKPEPKDIIDDDVISEKYHKNKKSFYKCIVIASIYFVMYFVLTMGNIFSKIAGYLCIVLYIYLLIVSFKTFFGYVSIKNDIKRNERNLVYNAIGIKEDIERYNEEAERHAIAMEDYNKKLGTISLEYETIKKNNDAKIESNNKKIDELKQKLKASKVKLTDEYYGDIDRIVSILESGRAETVKEALNILENDKYNDKMIMLQREENINAEEHRKQMLEEQRKMRKEQEISNIIAHQQNEELLKEQRENNRMLRDSMYNKSDRSICTRCKNAGHCIQTPNGSQCVHFQG